jgi:hypothetical protein
VLLVGPVALVWLRPGDRAVPAAADLATR